MINIKITKKKQKRLTPELRSIFEKNDIQSKLKVLNDKMLEANFWQDKNNSKNVIKEKKLFEDLLNTYKISIEKLSDLDDLSDQLQKKKMRLCKKKYYKILKNLEFQ